jgi:putative holliday junction resolvase
MGRILAIDYGTKRIGIAISDLLHMSSNGLPNIENNQRKFEEIAKIVQNESVEEVVIGLPRKLNGTIGEAAQAVQQFSEELKKYINVPIVFWDEWMTTAEAEKHLISQDKSRAKRKEIRDRVAAQLILQGYLDSKANKG